MANIQCDGINWNKTSNILVVSYLYLISIFFIDSDSANHRIYGATVVQLG